MDQIKDIYDLILFLMVLSQEKMKSFLEASQLLKHYIKNDVQMALLLQLFDIEKSKLIIDVLKSQIPELINIKALEHLAKTVTPEHLSLIVAAWDLRNLPVTSANDVLFLMELLPDSEKEPLYLQYQTLIKSISNYKVFIKFMAILPEQYKADCYNENKSLIVDLSNPCVISDINEIFKALPEEFRKSYLDAIMSNIGTILPKYGASRMCEKILEFLTPEQRSAVFQSVQHTLVENLKIGWKTSYSEDDMNFLNYLTDAQCIALLKPLERIRFYSSGFMTPVNLGKNLSYLSDQKCRTVCFAWKQSILSILKSTNDIILLFDKSSTENTFSTGGRTSNRRLNVCSILYDLFKDKITSILKTENEYNQLKPYLKPEDQLDLSHNITLYKIQPWLPSSRVEAFKSALMDHESEIQTAFDALFKPTYIMRSLFSGKTKTNANLIQIIACMETGWLHKINAALSLGLSNEQLASQTTIKAALENYVTATSHRNQTPRV